MKKSRVVRGGWLIKSVPLLACSGYYRLTASLATPLVYGAVGTAAGFGAWALGHPIFLGEPLWPTLALRLGFTVADTLTLLISAAAGIGIAAITTRLTRILVRSMRWARNLRDDLHPVVAGAPDSRLLIWAVASGISEELLFRALLLPLVGIVLSAALFGFLHQVRGPARWGWMGWAFAMGLAFGILYSWTHSIVGPAVAHVLINWVNLRFIRDTGGSDPTRFRATPLGGIFTTNFF